MAKEKNDFFNVIELTQDFEKFRESALEDIDDHELSPQSRIHLKLILRQLGLQLGMLQQLTMISKHSEQFARALSDIAAEVKRTAERK
jgi:hypothetical protein